MKTKARLEEDILNITMKINREFPELFKYLTEMPETIPDKDNVGASNKNLEEYYRTLVEMHTKYSKTHIENKEREIKPHDNSNNN